MKTALAWMLSLAIGVALHFGIFMFAYRKLTFPFLHEEQRAENAYYIFFYIFPAILVATLITILILSVCLRNKK